MTFLMNRILRKIKNIGYQETLREMASLLWSHSRIDSILKTTDLQAFKRLDQQYNKQDIVGVGRKKYLAIKPWMKLNLRYLYLLGLHKPPRPLRILDIGTGFGYFPFLCQSFGHVAVGLDLDMRDMYNDAIRILGVDRRTWRVEAYQPLPDLGEKFDVVTAFMICFDNHGDKSEPWGIEEWNFLLNDLKTRQMTEQCRILFQFNRPLVEMNPKLHHLFLEKGAMIDLGRVYFRSLRG